MNNVSTERSVSSHPSLATRVIDHQTVVLVTKDSLGEDKPFSVGNIPSLKFTVGPTNQGITGNIMVAWDPDISVVVFMAVCVPVEEDLLGIVINTRRVEIRLEYDCDEAWIKSLK